MKVFEGAGLRPAQPVSKIKIRVVPRSFVPADILFLYEPFVGYTGL
ncbi:MAG: hypothetical protein ACE5DR_01900 [Thermodesulfobacteriota bacterium]